MHCFLAGPLRGAAGVAAVTGLWAISGCRPKPAVLPPPVDLTVNSVPSGPSKIVDGVGFADITRRSGIDLVMPMQPRPMRNIEAFGTGCAFLDFDQDGKQDILLVARPYPHLYHNLGNGHFEDVSIAVGLNKIQGYWNGVAVADYDSCGFPDILLTGFRCLALLHNDHAKAFVNVTKPAGLVSDNRHHWGASAGFMDLDGTGRLSFVLTNYVVINSTTKEYCELTPGIRTGCPPREYVGEMPELWQNVGNGKFRDTTAALKGKSHGTGLVVAFSDIYGSGKMDFYIGNDGKPADVLRNDGNYRFTNVGMQSGLAFGSHPGIAMAAMGADWADYDRDGKLDLAVPDFSNEPYAVFHAQGQGLFQYSSDELGISGPTIKPLGFGTKWLDMDNDGWPDLTFANGHVYDRSQEVDPLQPYREPLMLFHNQAGKQFVDLVPQMGGDLARPMVGRGSATGDIDNDGRVDLLVVDFEGRPMLLHNISPAQNHWITLDLRGAPPNTFAYGAELKATGGGKVWVGQVSPSSSYLSYSDPRVHFGLGAVTALDTVRIRWSDGRVQEHHNLGADHFVTIHEGGGVSTAAPGQAWP